MNNLDDMSALLQLYALELRFARGPHYPLTGLPCVRSRKKMIEVLHTPPRSSLVIVLVESRGLENKGECCHDFVSIAEESLACLSFGICIDRLM